jgi:hypothetical protein
MPDWAPPLWPSCSIDRLRGTAAIDIGSDAVRLLLSEVFETDTGPYFRKISLIRMMIRLGGDVFINGKEDLNHLTPPNQGVYAPGQSHVEIKRQGL